LWRLVLLRRARLLESWPGRAGGSRLARPAKDITLLRMIETVEGPIRSGVPQAVTGAVSRIDFRLQQTCASAGETARRRLGRVSVANLAGRRKGGRL
jgi:DNA-binding IscR family transcriptional regulator